MPVPYFFRFSDQMTVARDHAWSRKLCPCAQRLEYLEDIDRLHPEISDIETILTYIHEGKCPHVTQWKSIVEQTSEASLTHWPWVPTRVYIDIGHLAAATGHLTVLKFAVEAGWSVNTSSGYYGVRSIHLAITKHKPHVLQYLLSDDCKGRTSGVAHTKSLRQEG